MSSLHICRRLPSVSTEGHFSLNSQRSKGTLGVRRLFFSIIISALLVWLLARNLNYDGLVQAIRSLRWEYSPLVLSVFSMSSLARAVRWKMLTNSDFAIYRYFHILNVGFLVNNTLPFRIGELVRAYLISNEIPNYPPITALASIAVERVLDLVSIVILIFVVLVISPLDTSVVFKSLVLGAIGIVAFTLFLILARYPSAIRQIIQKLFTRFPSVGLNRLESFVNQALDSLHVLGRSQSLIPIILWTAISWSISMIGMYALALMFPDFPWNLHSVVSLILAVALASLSIALPYTIAGVGPFELACIFALSTAGIQQDTATIFAIIWHGSVLLTYALWGTIGILYLGKKISVIGDIHRRT